MKKFIALTISCLILSGTIFSQSNPVSNLWLKTVYAQEKSTTENMANIILEQYGASSIQYALIDNGEIKISNTIESKLIKNPQGLDKNTIYGIGSVSKMYTAAAVMSLVDKGLLDIDKPIIKYIPEFKMADKRYKEITARMLLNHSSGIYGTYFKDSMLFEEKSRNNHDELLEVLKKQNLKYNPGEMSEYCNDGFSLLEILVERISKEDFSDYYRKNFTEPLNLKSTKTSSDSFEKNKLAEFYLPPFEKALPKESTNIIGTGGFYSTAEEICKFGEVLIGKNEKLLSKSSVLAMQNEEYKNGIHPIDDGENIFGHGLGWDNVTAEPFQQYNIKALFKGGDTIQSHAVLIAIPEHDLVAAVTSSGGSSLFNYSIAVDILENALLEKGVIGEIKPNKTFEAPVSKPLSENISEFSGTYASSGGLELDFEVKKDGSLDVPGIMGFIPPQNYVYTGDNSFTSPDGKTVLTFVKNEKNTFIQANMYLDFPGLKQLVMKSFAFQKLEPNSVEKDVLDVWNKRNNSVYYLLDDSPNSEQYYFPGSIAPVKLNVNSKSGYAYGGAKIKDKNTAINVLNFRDVVDLNFYVKDNIEYLQSRGFTFISSENISDIWSNGTSFTTIQNDGFTRWFKTGSAEGKEMVVDIPKNATFFVYDENGVCIHHSLVNGSNKVVLPKNGVIGFAGNSKDIFKINIQNSKTNLK